jgi:uracil-DNA glycosylase family 4
VEVASTSLAAIAPIIPQLVPVESTSCEFFLTSSRSVLMDAFDLHCTRCPRLTQSLAGVRRAHPDYHARPVAPFGARRARLLIVGLAPGLHGANRTGRPFTGDYAGILLYRTLHKFGFASQPQSVSRDDGLRLRDCRITNAVKCWPPANKPLPKEIATCNSFLAAELAALKPESVLLALGRIAHEAVLRALGLKLRDHPFAHGQRHRLPGGLQLVDSYHCSRYNTQTRRLTTAMFESVVRRARTLLGKK